MSDTSLGSIIRSKRKALDLTMTQMASAVGVSAGYISQVERDLVTPSIRTVERIAGCLGVSIGDLFAEEGSDQKLPSVTSAPIDHTDLKPVRASQRPKIIFDDIVGESLIPIPSLGLPFFAYIADLKPEPTFGGQIYSHRGYELILVLEGSMEWKVGNKTCLLNEGDSIYYSSEIEHGGRQVNDRPVKILVLQVQ